MACVSELRQRSGGAVRKALLSLSCLLLFLFALQPAWAEHFDTLIRRGRVVDGTGSPWYWGDVGIRNGRIAAIGRLTDDSADKVIEARGMIVAPGFIDLLGQSQGLVLSRPGLLSKAFQGVTTEFSGEGYSAAPRKKSGNASGPDWETFEEFFALLDQNRVGLNVGYYVGATQVRQLIVGFDNRPPTQDELESMKALVGTAVRQGAFGLSSSLMYPPGLYAATDELIALARESGRLGGIYATHLRNEGDGILRALEEAFEIARKADVAVEILHLKAAGKNNWGRMPEIVASIERARRQGLDITANTYAYDAWHNALSSFIPPWAHEGGRPRLVERLKDLGIRERLRREIQTPDDTWDNVWQEIPGPENVLLGGQTLAEAAKARQKDPIDTIFDVLIEDRAGTSVAVFGMSEDDVCLALLQPWVSVATDAAGYSPNGEVARSYPHPRAYGTYPRVLRKYVQERQKLRLEEAIRKFTALPAQRMGLVDRGVLKAGVWADIVVFAPEAFRDRATFREPHQLAKGMTFVLVNGIPVIEEGQPTGALPGHVLRRGYTPSFSASH